MNKIIIILVVLILASGSFFIFMKYGQKDVQITDQKITPTSEPDNNQQRNDPEDKTVEVENDSNTYKIKSLLVRDPSDIYLYSNLEDKLSSAQAMTKNDCTDLVTAGFYTTEYSHIGLFISNYNSLSQPDYTLESSAYFSIDESDIPTIGSTPDLGAKHSVQSYPLVYRNDEPVQLNNVSDDKARRIIVATTSDDQVVFLVIYNSDSVYSGPVLSDVPDMVEQFDQQSEYDIQNAVNLDGGSHSAFISRFVRLPELSTIGSYFCMKY